MIKIWRPSKGKSPGLPASRLEATCLTKVRWIGIRAQLIRRSWGCIRQVASVSIDKGVINIRILWWDSWNDLKKNCVRGNLPSPGTAWHSLLQDQAQLGEKTRNNDVSNLLGDRFQSGRFKWLNIESNWIVTHGMRFNRLKFHLLSAQSTTIQFRVISLFVQSRLSKRRPVKPSAETKLRGMSERHWVSVFYPRSKFKTWSFGVLWMVSYAMRRIQKEKGINSKLIRNGVR